MTDDPQTNLLLGRLGIVYGQPRPDPEDAVKFIAEYARLMRQYVDSELEEAAERILQHRKWKTWPTIAECIAALEAVRASKRARLLAEQAQARQAAQAEPKVYSERELREARQFVDDCADGKVDMGLCSAALRRLAISMRARRRAS